MGDNNDGADWQHVFKGQRFSAVKFLDRQTSGGERVSQKIVRIQELSDQIYAGSTPQVDQGDALSIYEICVQSALFWILLACKFDSSMQECESWEPGTIFGLAPWFTIWRTGTPKSDDVSDMYTLEGYAALYLLDAGWARAQGESGSGIHEASGIERLTQLAEVADAADFLMAVDLVDVSSYIARQLPAENEYAKYASSGTEAFRFYILPLALATLHTWRRHVKNSQQQWQDGDEMTFLWRAQLQVMGASHAVASHADGRLSPAHFECLLGGDVNDTARLRVDKPIVAMSMREHWATLQALVRRTPTMVMGRGFRKLLSLLVWRLSVFVSAQGGTDMFDMMAFVVPVEYSVDSAHAGSGNASDGVSTELVLHKQAVEDGAPLQANDRYLKETEFMCSDLVEMALVWRRLEHPSARKRFIGTRARRVRWPPRVYGWEIPDGLASNWTAYIAESCRGTLGSFIERSLSNYAWGHYKYWGEEERFMHNQGSRNYRMRQVVGQYRKADFDTIDGFLKSTLPLHTVYMDAVAFSQQEWTTLVEKFGEERLRREGFCWQSIWDIEKRSEHTRMEDIKNNRVRGLQNVIPIANESTGDVTFIDSQTQRRLRGDRLVAAKAFYNMDKAPAGAAERFMVELYVVNAVMMGNADTEGVFYIQDQCATDNKLLYSIDALCGTTANVFSGGPSSLNSPVVIFSCGKFLVFAGNKTLYETPYLHVAVYYWALFVELQVRRKLDRIGSKLQQHPDDAQSIRDSLKMAHIQRMRIPPQFRILFQLERSPTTAQAVNSHHDDELLPYAIPSVYQEAFPCCWDTIDLRSRLV